MHTPSPQICCHGRANGGCGADQGPPGARGADPRTEAGTRPDKSPPGCLPVAPAGQAPVSVCIRKFLNTGRFYGCNTVIIGGDIAGKMIDLSSAVPAADQNPHAQHGYLWSRRPQPRQYGLVGDCYRTPGGWTVEVVQIAAGDRLRIRHHGFYVADVANVDDLARWIPAVELAQLERNTLNLAA